MNPGHRFSECGEVPQDKKRCQYELFVNKYFELPDNFPEAGWAIDFDYGQVVNLLAMFDDERNAWHKQNLENVMHERDLELSSLRDQRKKDGAMHLKHKQELAKEIDVLRDQLRQRDELMKELIEGLKAIHGTVKHHYLHGGSTSASFLDSIESLIKKANSLT